MEYIQQIYCIFILSSSISDKRFLFVFIFTLYMIQFCFLGQFHPIGKTKKMSFQPERRLMPRLKLCRRTSVQRSLHITRCSRAPPYSRKRGGVTLFSASFYFLNFTHVNFKSRAKRHTNGKVMTALLYHKEIFSNF